MYRENGSIVNVVGMVSATSMMCLECMYEHLHHAASARLRALAAIGLDIIPRRFGKTNAGVWAGVVVATNVRIGRFKVARSIVVAWAVILRTNAAGNVERGKD